MRLVFVFLLAVAPGCALSQSPPATSAATRASLRIAHVAPRENASGLSPARLEWTPVIGADHYIVGVWNEAGVMVMRHDAVREAFIAVPTENPLPFGTYFWMVTAIRNEQAIAESGRAAFVVLQ